MLDPSLLAGRKLLYGYSQGGRGKSGHGGYRSVVLEEARRGEETKEERRELMSLARS